VEISLRPLALSDWEAVHSWASREESCRYQAWGPNTPEETKAFVAEAVAAPPSRRSHVIVLGDQVVGMASLRLTGGRTGELVYLVHPDFWGRGIATEAARQLLALGFGEHDLHRIFATCDPRNVGSARVLTKVGMRHEGRMRATMLIRDGWRDSDLYAILESDQLPAPVGVDLATALFAKHPAVRYVAIRRGAELTLRERDGLANASSSESDRYEELLVNPALLTLTTNRGDIDCGGLRYVVVGYGNFQQLVVPRADGHISVAIDHGTDPLTVLADIPDLS
jgi:RimJ/RimL family protein N-acetyltransferase